MEPLDTPSSTPTETPAGRSPFRPNRLTSGIVAGGAAFAMVLAGLGIASAQTDDGTATTTPPAASADPARPDGRRPGHHLRPSLTIASQVLGISLDDLRTQLRSGKSLGAIAGDRKDELIAALVADGRLHLDDAVAHGRLTQAQADERKATLEERVTALVDATPPLPAGDGDGEGAGDHGPGHGRGPGARMSLQTVATTLGISEEDLRSQLESGKSLAAIAGDKTPAVVDALVAEATARLDAAVADGKLTQAQADERKAGLRERIAAMVERTPPAPGERGPGRHHDGPPPEDAPAGAPAEAAPASVTA